jgi:hypothetical protein
VQQAQLGAGLPAESSAHGHALEQQAMRAEQALSSSASRVSVGAAVPARRGASARRGAAVDASSSPLANSSGSLELTSATASATPVEDGRGSHWGDAAITTSPSGASDGRSPSSSITPMDVNDALSGVRGEAPVSHGRRPRPVQERAGRSAESSPPGVLGGATSTPVRARSVPPVVLTSGSLEPRRAPIPRSASASSDLGRTGVSSVASVTGAGPASASSIQRRASRGPGDGTIRAVGSQEDSVEAPPPKGSGGSRAWPTPAKDTARDQEWLVRHAQALYPLMRNLLRAELLRDRERRGQMLKENF